MTLHGLLLLVWVTRGVFGVTAQLYADNNCIFVDVSQNVTLPCMLHTRHNYEEEVGGIKWQHEGRHSAGEHVLPNGSLALTNVTRHNSGHYSCLVEDTDKLISSICLVVRGPPDAPENVTVHASTVVATISWHQDLHDEWENSVLGPKITLHLEYRPLHSDIWHRLPHYIAPTQKRVEVTHLQPNTTYEFQLWTSNSFGDSDVVSVLTTTQEDVSERELVHKLEQCLDGFSPSVWLVAVLVVMVAAKVLGILLLVLYYFQHKAKKSAEYEDPEKIELVPHIIENPGYQWEKCPQPDTLHQSLLSSNTAVV